jgi:GNAT superfamily N-acetyltransferase
MPSNLSIETAAPADWPALAPFLFERNRVDGDVRCLHSHAGLDAAAYAKELRSLPADEACYVAAHEDGELIGVAGAEFDASIGRAWLRGPLVAAGRDFGAVAAPLLDALCAQLPLPVVQLDVFVSSGCGEAIDFFRSQGFGSESAYGEYTCLPPAPAAAAIAPGVALVAPDPRWRAAIGALHNAEFSRAYVSADALFEPDLPDPLTRIALLDGAPAGYVRVHFDAQWQEGYVDFLAVAPAARRRGVGRALLQAAREWSFAQPGARAVTLTVRADRDAARALYEAAGFRRVRICIGLRRLVAR